MTEKDINLELGLQEDEEMTVTLTLDDDTELECAVVAIFPVAEKQYIALLPLDDESEEVFLYRFSKNGDEMQLDNIEEDEEFDAVADAYDMLLDDMEYDEMLGDDEEEK
ncbi:MAG: DUF1292 domain-containing protein [bacterium]|nr:DUF1292 domain-containing protein [bacterium]